MEGERQGEKHPCERETSVSCFFHAPNQGHGLQPTHEPWLEIEPVTLGLMSWHSTTEQLQSGQHLLLIGFFYRFLTVFQAAGHIVTSSFPTCMPFISSCCLIVMTKYFSEKFNREDESERTSLCCSQSRGKAFSYSPLSIMLAVGFLQMPFIRLKKFLSISILWRIFIMNCGEFCYIFFCIYWDGYLIPSPTSRPVSEWACR